jgi:hypothetical protein
MAQQAAWWLSLTLVLVFMLPLAARGGTKRDTTAAPWRGVHLLNYNTDKDLEILAKQVPKLAEMGLNVIILEINYGFHFESYPRLRNGREQVTPDGARKLAVICKKHGIRLIPQFQCVGHQSWKSNTFPLLTVYPEFDLTPGAFPENKGIYCREWDVTNPKVNDVVLKLMDEILDAFKADAMHVGMDEIFLLGSEQSPRTKGQDPAKLFARAVNDFHEHLVKQRKVEMLMWGDRLFDAKKYNWSEWEAARNGTAPAVDLIPKDIIICPWHYELMPAYPSVPMFLDKGFRVLPASWHKLDASRALIEHNQKLKSPKMLGHLFTTWEGKKESLLEYQPMVEGLKLLQEKEK